MQKDSNKNGYELSILEEEERISIQREINEKFMHILNLLKEQINALRKEKLNTKEEIVAIKESIKHLQNEDSTLSIKRLCEIILSIQTNLKEAKEDILANSYAICSAKQEIKDLREDLAQKELSSTQIENVYKNIDAALKNNKNQLSFLTSCMEVFSRHISILEQRSKRFSDNFRFGKFKFKSLKEESLMQEGIKEALEKSRFKLND
ncbi:hypothetical protein [Helicobacter turcicus]|uniref:Uncharacterized protein n=1 Tax=Helicobacter turcicus TaxID=2867412 RepID=A0ABS7JPB9_9HELI|nr:hypothetical protein [Helicobacter turcicus]MBX7491213.1 hypothetical protein [Helicobacter turcicus]MBX7546148.1 hypothetical protein [Helicobacter turcicus]